MIMVDDYEICWETYLESVGGARGGAKWGKPHPSPVSISEVVGETGDEEHGREVSCEGVGGEGREEVQQEGEEGSANDD